MRAMVWRGWTQSVTSCYTLEASERGVPRQPVRTARSVTSARDRPCARRSVGSGWPQSQRLRVGRALVAVGRSGAVPARIRWFGRVSGAHVVVVLAGLLGGVLTLAALRAGDREV